MKCWSMPRVLADVMNNTVHLIVAVCESICCISECKHPHFYSSCCRGRAPQCRTSIQITTTGFSKQLKTNSPRRSDAASLFSFLSVFVSCDQATYVSSQKQAVGQMMSVSVCRSIYLPFILPDNICLSLSMPHTHTHTHNHTQ